MSQKAVWLGILLIGSTMVRPSLEVTRQLKGLDNNVCLLMLKAARRWRELPEQPLPDSQIFLIGLLVRFEPPGTPKEPQPIELHVRNNLRKFYFACMFLHCHSLKYLFYFVLD